MNYKWKYSVGFPECSSRGATLAGRSSFFIPCVFFLQLGEGWGGLEIDKASWAHHTGLSSFILCKLQSHGWIIWIYVTISWIYSWLIEPRSLGRRLLFGREQGIYSLNTVSNVHSGQCRLCHGPHGKWDENCKWEMARTTINGNACSRGSDQSLGQ